jgi:hypothetical protein
MPGGPVVNLAGADEHVPEMSDSEGQVLIVSIPKLTTIHAVLQNVKMLNFFPPKNGNIGTPQPKDCDVW